MADWDEIKRLAADFQRTQLSDTLQRLSERNCIDLIKMLTDLKQIELVYSIDGKEFITPSHLRREIEDEIYYQGGRMQIHDLASKLNVDYNHIDKIAKDLDKEEDYNLILGQIIHSNYKTTLGKQIQDLMLTTGQLSIAEFSKSLDLPSEFLLSIVKDLIPTIVKDFVVSQDGRTYYTSEMMDKYKSIITGTLSAITRPTSIPSIMKRLDITEKIFMPIVEGLIKEGRIDGTIENRVFIPVIYAKEQSDWINGFYTSNSYIEYDVLSRMDIKQPKAYLKRKYPDGIQLKTCFVSRDLLSQIESLVEDTIASNGWIDISSMIPSAIEPDDIDLLLQDILKKNKALSSCLVINKVNICSLGFISARKQSFEKYMEQKARQHLEDGKLMNHFLGGMPNFGRETQIKNNESVREAQDPKSVEDNDDENKRPSESDNKKQKDQIDTEDGLITKESKRDKKGVKFEEFEDSDEEQTGKKSRSRKSGGGAQGREIKQKSVKKKYIPGNKGNQKTSDDESGPSKVPRSNKGRAARRAISPERISTPSKGSKNVPQKEMTPKKEPLIFMDINEIVDELKKETNGDDSEIFESIAAMIIEDLNTKYEILARKILDEFIKSQSEIPDEGSIVREDETTVE